MAIKSRATAAAVAMEVAREALATGKTVGITFLYQKRDFPRILGRRKSLREGIGTVNDFFWIRVNAARLPLDAPQDC